MKVPGFTATQSLLRSCVMPAETPPGGPGNVPRGYNRECKRLPFWVCTPQGCHTEYYWECTFTPIRT